MTGVGDTIPDDRAYVAALSRRCEEAVASMGAEDSSAALARLRALSAECDARLGPAHRQSVRLRASLASWTGEQGEPARAGTDLTALWEYAVRTFGERDADTLLIACNAAAFTGIGGDPPGAVRLLERVVDDVEAVFGVGSTTARTAHGNLRVWRRRAGEPSARRPS